MDKTALVTGDIEEGRRLVQDLMDAKFPVQAALWLYLSDTDEWRLMVASQVVDQKGPREAYKKIQSILARLSPPSGIALKDISVLSPQDELIQLLGKAIRTGSRLANIRFTRNTINGTFIEDAHIYLLS